MLKVAVTGLPAHDYWARIFSGGSYGQRATCAQWRTPRRVHGLLGHRFALLEPWDGGMSRFPPYDESSERVDTRERRIRDETARRDRRAPPASLRAVVRAISSASPGARIRHSVSRRVQRLGISMSRSFGAVAISTRVAPAHRGGGLRQAPASRHLEAREGLAVARGFRNRRSS